MTPSRRMIVVGGDLEVAHDDITTVVLRTGIVQPCNSARPSRFARSYHYSWIREQC